MKLTTAALNSSRFTLLAALLILVGGVSTFLSFPAQEEPTLAPDVESFLREIGQRLDDK